MADGEPSTGKRISPTTRFRFRGTDVAGAVRSGEMDAVTPYEVRAALRSAGVTPVAVAAVDPPLARGGGRGWGNGAWGRVLLTNRRNRRREAKADLCDAIATLARAGVTLDDALTTLASSAVRSDAERALLGRLRDAVRSGRSLADACRDEPGWFDDFDVAILGAGARSGDAANALTTIALHHHRMGSIGQRLTMALAYPVLLALAGLAAWGFLGVQVLPKLVQMITQAKQSPPFITLVAMHGGQAIVVGWPLLLAGAVGLVWLAGWVRRHTPTAGRLGALVHRNPLALATRRYALAHLAWSLARLRKAGLPLIEAVAIAGKSSSDPLLRELLDHSEQAIRRGEDFSTVLGSSPLLDPEVSKLIHLGERSGELTSMLEQVAERAFRTAERTTDRLAAVAGPAAILLLAVLIGVLVIACALPLAHLGDLV